MMLGVRHCPGHCGYSGEQSILKVELSALAELIF